ncbi:SpoIID/LytB domain-containing protein [Serpentinicella sp. ANB-PHB4]|nr:SpoIID/LytB domain-containing protein [Serpentinicella sp. ANB-PHB4]MDR5658829.1 SpoIID/LytB domain-containing protein [Serpentinicella sp. ANB-PHB4]
MAPGVETAITYSNDNFVLTANGQTHTNKNPLRVVGDDNSVLQHKGLEYFGTFEISRSNKRDSSGTELLDLINILNIETYLRGVVPGEIYVTWPMDTIKAQTLAARTYALRHINSSRKYDVCDTVMSQVYKGVSIDNERTNTAIQETRGEVIVHNNLLIDAVYSASAGGHTIDAADIWGGNIPYLIGKPDPYDTSQFSRNWWTYEITTEDLSKLFTEVGQVEGIRIDQMKNERPTRIRVIGDKGEVTLSGYAFRSRIGNNHMRSSIFEFEEIR